MAELCLCVAADDLPMVDQGHVVAALLLTAQLHDRLSEHLHVQRHRVGASEHVEPVEVLALLVRVLGDEVAELFVSHDHAQAFPPLLELLVTRLLVEVRA